MHFFLKLGEVWLPLLRWRMLLYLLLLHLVVHLGCFVKQAL